MGILETTPYKATSGGNFNLLVIKYNKNNLLNIINVELYCGRNFNLITPNIYIVYINTFISYI